METWQERCYRMVDAARAKGVAIAFSEMLKKRSVRREASRILSWWKRDYLGRKTGTLMASENRSYLHALAVACFRLAVVHDELCSLRPRLLARYPAKWREACSDCIWLGHRIEGFRDRYIDYLYYDLQMFEDMAIHKKFGPKTLDELLARYKN